MVFPGRFSTGCRLCRKRKVKVSKPFGPAPRLPIMHSTLRM
jgi:hypothetical protein